MYGILLSLFAAFALFSGLYFTGTLAVVWCSVYAALLFLICQIGTALFLHFRTKKMNGELQVLMQEVQQKIQRRQQYFNLHPGGSQKQMMQLLEKEQTLGMEKALAILDRYIWLAKWNIMAGKQICTMRMAFLYQMKRFAEVDALLPKCLFMEPQTISMKLARMTVKNDPGIDKFFRRKFRMLKGENCVLPVAVYTWHLVKQGKTDEAVKVFVQARRKTDNEVIRRNWEALVNNKVKKFSNSGLAENWYALGLEEMKIPRMQMRYR